MATAKIVGDNSLDLSPIQQWLRKRPGAFGSRKRVKLQDPPTRRTDDTQRAAEDIVTSLAAVGLVSSSYDTPSTDYSSGGGDFSGGGGGSDF